ncbi:hypothetical protein F3Y22_tig00110893pilonHSYRG01056 [Hibiscus syriacus]|uniref:ubiquitinyl hydrolase 1 n=1 Tax=Hibiscus syriacus TaxID=106335 RepID=A0A6A2ZHN7_HIBSY|nr:hypothetical protein F3Y22_tig00110893pilonHSYRG01056 [Hibiscus syriacus]
MTRILVQRGSAGSSSSNPSRTSSSPGPSSFRVEPQVSTHQVPSAAKEGDVSEEVPEQDASDEHLECLRSSGNKGVNDDPLLENLHNDWNETSSDTIAVAEKVNTLDALGSSDMLNDLGGLRISAAESEGSSGDPSPIRSGSPHPPPPPVPPPKPSSANSHLRRFVSGSSNPVRAGLSRRAVAWPIVSTRTSPSESRPSSPRSHAEEAKGLEVKRMLEDGNCLFRAVADQVYGDSEAYDLTRQMCIDYMERERDHFSQFITEGFTSYCKRKRRDKVYGNNVEIQALSEMYNRPIHIYSYSIEPINIFHGSYNTDTPPIRLSYHHGNHYNSLVDPRRLTIGAGLGFSCLQGCVYISFSDFPTFLLLRLTDVDKDQVKAAIKAQQDQQIDNASIFGRSYSDLELTEKEIERMVMEASRAEYLANDKFKMHVGLGKELSASTAETSSSGDGGASGSESKMEQETVLSSGMQLVLSMGFSYLQAIEAYGIFGDDVDSMVCYLLETDSSSRCKGKATQ